MPNNGWTSYFTKKVIIGLTSVATVLSIVAGIWAFESHYATNARVDKDLTSLEEAIAGALQNQQHKSDVRYFQFEYDRVNRDLQALRTQMQRNPNDELLKQDYQELLERRKIIKERLDQSLKNIKIRTN